MPTDFNRAIYSRLVKFRVNDGGGDGIYRPNGCFELIQQSSQIRIAQL